MTLDVYAKALEVLIEKKRTDLLLLRRNDPPRQDAILMTLGELQGLETAAATLAQVKRLGEGAY